MTTSTPAGWPTGGKPAAKPNPTGEVGAKPLAATPAVNPPPAPKVPSVPTVKVELRQRTVLEPGCRVVDPGTIVDIPESQYDPTYHILVKPAAAAKGKEPQGWGSNAGTNKAPAAAPAAGAAPAGWSK
jgi:hypothetical protein